MQLDMLVRNCEMYLSDRTVLMDIGIAQERIVCVGENLDMAAHRIFDAEGRPVFPGGVDAHVHTATQLGGYLTQDTFFESTKAAARGGTTTIIDFCIPEQGQGPDLIEMMDERIAAISRDSVVDVALHAGLSRLDSGDIERQIREAMRRGITSFKMFSAYPGSVMINYGEIFQAMRIIAQQGGVAVIHAEHQDLINMATQGKNLAVASSHRDSRPVVSESVAVSTLLALVEATQCPTYFVHISSQEALAQIHQRKVSGLRVGAETCPHYLTLDGSLYDTMDGALYVCSPPLRDQLERTALWNGVAGGSVDLISSDHCCFGRSQKFRHRDDFRRIANGLPGVETRMPLIYDQGVRTGIISAYQFQQVTATGPAQWLGLYPQKGVLQPGSDADVVIWDPDRSFPTATTTMATDFLPYSHLALRGMPVLVIARGRVVWNDEDFVGRRGQGRFVRRRPVRQQDKSLVKSVGEGVL